MKPWLPFGFRRQAVADAPLHEVRYAVIDTELTSLNPRSNRLLSIGAVTMDGAKIRVGDVFYRIVDPGVEPPAAGVLIHKLRPTDVKGGEPPESALAALREFIGDRVIVGHFVGIDLKALRKELGDKHYSLTNVAIDTARVQRWIVQNGPPREDIVQQLETLDLASLAKAYDLDFRQAHNALDDAFVTARLWQKMLSKLDTMKTRSLRQLLRIAQA